jgi:hypothetical protein
VNLSEKGFLFVVYLLLKNIMAIESLRVTKKELQTYYTPKVSDYELMVNSINSTMGYGQIIQRYLDDNILNTYFHVYSIPYGAEIVYDRTTGQLSYVVNAGPTFWGVSSEIGVEFLNGITDIDGLRKLKYCDGCSDGNGLNKPVIDNFSKRFRKVNELVLAYNLLEGFLFYDDSLPKYSNVFPSIKRDDGINIIYQFKDVNSGDDLSVEQVSLITDTPVVAIEASITTAPVVKPQEGSNTVITSCCDESIFYVIPEQYTIGNILYTDSLPESYCWFVESLTNNTPTLPASFTFSPGGRSCEACVRLNPCPVVCDEVLLTYSTDPLDACSGEPQTYQSGEDGVLYNDGGCGTSIASVGYYGNGNSIYSWDGVTIEEIGPCPGSGSYIIQYCCDGSEEFVETGGKGLYPGTYVYFSADDSITYPIPCWYVVGPSTKKPSITGTFNGETYEGCKDCAYSTGQLCGG